MKIEKGVSKYTGKDRTRMCWKIWSGSVERGYLQYLDENKEYTKAWMARGKATFTEKEPLNIPTV